MNQRGSVLLEVLLATAVFLFAGIVVLVLLMALSPMVRAQHEDR